jgi:hypothetical protein
MQFQRQLGVGSGLRQRYGQDIAGHGALGQRPNPEVVKPTRSNRAGAISSLPPGGIVVPASAKSMTAAARPIASDSLCRVRFPARTNCYEQNMT